MLRRYRPITIIRIVISGPANRIAINVDPTVGGRSGRGPLALNLGRTKVCCGAIPLGLAQHLTLNLILVTSAVGDVATIELKSAAWLDFGAPEGILPKSRVTSIPISSTEPGKLNGKVRCGAKCGGPDAADPVPVEPKMQAYQTSLLAIVYPIYLVGL